MTNIDEKILYDAIVERGEWLEDDGDCSRYHIGEEDSIWVCHRCEEVIDDPTEHSCFEEDEE
jgi:hypothetical protein